MLNSSNRAATHERVVSAQAQNFSKFASSNHKKTWRFWGGTCFVLVLLGAFAQPLFVLLNYAVRSDLYSYILLVPFVSAYLLYIRRDRLPKKYATDLPVTIAFLVTGVAALPFAFWSDVAGSASAGNARIVLLTLSFLCCLAAGGFFFLGRDWMRAAAFPLAYLIFIVPIPDGMVDALETASKYASAEAANLFFHLSGTPILHAGAFFQLPNITIEVAQECSGIRSSWVLLMTSILAANLFLKSPWRWFVLVASVIPLAILRNGFRIFVIGLLCTNMGPQMIHSLIHRRGGPLFFVLSLIPFLLLLWWLHRCEGRLRPLKSG